MKSSKRFPRLRKTDPERIAVYGLIPLQQPADIYDGWGHGGRGGWSWYTGSAARMLSAAYTLLGIVESGGAIGVRDDLFEPKGELQLESLRIGNSIWRQAQRGASPAGRRRTNCRIFGLSRGFWLLRRPTLVETGSKGWFVRCGTPGFLA